MGWNQGYTMFEQLVIGAYDIGKLDKELLGVLMFPFGSTDIDSGGRTGMLTDDGKDVEQVVIETWGQKMPKKPACYDKNYDDMTEAERDKMDKYHEAIHEKFNKITAKFGWR